MNIKEIAESMNVNPAALESLIQYLLFNIEKNQELRRAFLKNPDQIIQLGVAKWLEASTRYYNTLGDPKSPEFKELADSVWETLNKKDS